MQGRGAQKDLTYGLPRAGWAGSLAGLAGTCDWERGRV